MGVLTLTIFCREGRPPDDTFAPHLVTALAHGIGAVITIDAMRTQADTAQVILGRGADYVMTVKATCPPCTSS